MQLAIPSTIGLFKVSKGLLYIPAGMVQCTDQSSPGFPLKMVQSFRSGCPPHLV